MMKTYFIAFMLAMLALFILAAAGCDKQEVTRYQTKGIIKNIRCDDNFLNGRGCVSVAKYIDGPYVGQSCNNNKLAGAIGDTINISITSYGNNSTFCEMR